MTKAVNLATVGSNANSGGTLITSGTVNGGAANPLSGGTTVDFTGIPSWVKRITVMLQGVSLTAIGAPLIQLGDSGGIETTGYFSNGLYFDNTAASNTSVPSTTGFLLRDATAAGVQYAVLTIVNVTGNVWLASGTAAIDAATDETGYIAGTKTLSDVLTQVRITRTGSGVFDAGTINILYE